MEAEAVACCLFTATCLSEFSRGNTIKKFLQKKHHGCGASFAATTASLP
jgi:hypothetical protein